MIWANNYHNQYTERLKAALVETGLSNIFNPSLRYMGDKLIVAFRAIDKTHQAIIQSYVAIFTTDFQRISLVNLTMHAKQYGIPKAADPKLFREDDESIWVTFNTGYSKTQNEIYIMKLFPQLETPRKCTYPDRQKVEKNWAFFFEGGRLFALYSLNPTVILKATTRSEREISFTVAHQGKTSTAPKLSIGTPLITLCEGQFGLIAHRKIGIFGKRMYFGVPIKLSKTTSGYRVEISTKKIAHNLSSLFGSRKKHNRNLISCTYFSGAVSRGDEVLLGYGINDVDCSFTILKKTELWK